MGLEQVKESILADARRAAEQELARARDEAKAIRGRAEAAVQQAKGGAGQRTEGAVQQLRRREVALAELEAKKLRLRAEKDLLALVRAKALERLRSLPPKQNDEYLTTLIQRAGTADARVYTRPEDKPLVERLGLKWAGPAEAVGGAVLESADGGSREDVRYENLLEDAWRDALGEVAGELFGRKEK